MDEIAPDSGLRNVAIAVRALQLKSLLIHRLQDGKHGDFKESDRSSVQTFHIVVIWLTYFISSFNQCVHIQKGVLRAS